MKNPQSIPAIYTLSAALLLMLACALRLYQIDQQSIWFDEGWSAYAAVQPDLLAAWNADATNPPLYYVLLNLTTRLWGDSPFSLRFFSLLTGLLVLPVAYRLAVDLFNLRAGLYVLWLSALSPLLWWAAQEARMYNLLALLVTVCAWAWQRLLVSPRRSLWALLLVSELLLLYAHNTGPVVVLWLNTATLLAWLTQRSLKSPPWRGWLAGQVLVGVCWLPYFITRFLSLQAANNAVVSRPPLTLEFLAQVWQAFWTGPWTLVGQEPLLLLFAAFAFVLFLALIPWRQSAARWLMVHSLLLVGGLVLGLSVLGNELHGRYLVMVTPLLLVPLAEGIARLPRLAAYGVTGMFVAGLLANIHYAQHPAYQHDDARAMVQHYAATLTAADTVLAWSYADRYDLRYYWDRLGVAAPLVTLPEGADQDTIMPLLPDSGQVALNVWYTQRADFRGMLDCLLSAGTRQRPVIQQVYGMSSLTYATSARQAPALQPSAVSISDQGHDIAVIDQTGIPVLSSPDQAVCLPIHLTMQQAVPIDLKASVAVRNSLGWEIARTDAIFATANQRPTSALAPGESATAYILLRLPAGAPAATYDLSLSIYDERVGVSGYDLRPAATAGVARTVRLDAWQATEAPQWSLESGTTELPVEINHALAPDLRLIAHDSLPDTPLRTGDTLRLTLLWAGAGPLPDLELIGTDWRLTLPAGNHAAEGLRLDWRELLIPLDVPAGRARLQLTDGLLLAEYTIEALPVLLEAPPFETAVDELMPGIGRLVGYTLPAEPINRQRPLAVTLVWQAQSSTIPASYVVFVQLLTADGQLIAQSDSVPVQGQRPTMGWREGEYLVDTHQLAFNERAVPGESRLIVGMYDAQTGERVSLGTGDYLTLPGIIRVQ